MKKFSAFMMLLTLGMFTVGCGGSDTGKDAGKDAGAGAGSSSAAGSEAGASEAGGGDEKPAE